MRHVLLVATVLGGCGDSGGEADDPPTQGEVDDARARVDGATDAIDQVRWALTELGILPDYTCGDPQGGYVSVLQGQLDGRYGCADVTTDSSDPSRDVVVATFPTTGCTIDGHTVTGTLRAGVAAGTDSFLLELDVTALGIDGRIAPVIASYATCGDETRYGAVASGADWSLDVVVAVRDGIPVIGGTTLILDGTGMRQGDQITFTGLEYEIGDTLPHGGTLVLQTANGHRIEATFTEASPVHLEVTVTIDDRDPVTIPLPA